MRFLYRICQNQKGLTSVEGEKQLPAISASASVEQPSPIQPTSQSSSTVSRLIEPLSSSAEQNTEQLPQTAAIRTSETSTPAVATVAATDTSSHKTTTVSVQPHIVSATTSVTQLSPITAAQITSVAPAEVPLNSASSQSLQTTFPGIRTQNRTKLINKSTNPSSITIAKAPSVSRLINPPASAVNKNLMRPLTIPVSRAPLPSSATVNNIPTQKQTPSVTVSKTRQQPAPAVTSKQTQDVACTEIPTQQPTSDTVTEELNQVPMTKTTAQSSSTDSTQTRSQPSSVADNILSKSDQVKSDDVPDDNKTKPSLSVGLGEVACKVLPEHVQSSESCTAYCKETPAVKCTDKLPTEVNREAVSESSVVTDIPPDTASKTKPNLANSVQQRTQIFARNSSILTKVTSDPTSNKAQLSTTKQQFQATRDTTKSPRVSQKVVDKKASKCLTSRKDKPDDSGKKYVREESSNILPNPEKKVEKQTSSIKCTPLASNNNNKLSNQSLQVLKNNQQILKKNDEIMRCPNIIKRTLILQRKPQDLLKPCSVQQRAQDDKSSSKKRSVMPAYAVKRPLGNSVDATEQNDMESAAKKWRLGIENNHNLSHDDKMSSELKVKCTSSSSDSQTPKNATGKSEASEASQIVPKAVTSTSQTPALVETTERQNNHGEQKNSLTDKMQSPIPVQRPAHKNHTNVLPKQCDSQSLNQSPKSESSTAKTVSTPPQIPASSSSAQNVKSPSIPVPAVAHCNGNTRLQRSSLKRKLDGRCNDVGALDLSASPRRQEQRPMMSIAQTLARRHHQQCPSPAPPPLSPLSSLSPFPVMSIPVRSPPPQLRIPVPQHNRSGHSQQQQRPSSLSSSSPSPPADTLPGCSRTGLQQQQPLDLYPSHLLPPSAVMFRQQLEMQRLWNSGKHSPNPRMEWFNDAKSIKSFENLVKTLQQQQGNRSSSFYPYNNNTTAAPNIHRK